MIFLIVVLMLYSIGALATLGAGAITIVEDADSGRDSEEYKTGIYLMKHAFVFPYAIVKMVRNTLDEADEENERRKNELR